MFFFLFLLFRISEENVFDFELLVTTTILDIIFFGPIILFYFIIYLFGALFSRA